MPDGTKYILGISAFYNDSAACLLRDGEIVAAAQEERFTRKRGDASFPLNAEYCPAAGSIQASELSYVGFYDKALLKFERILETYLSVVPKGFRSFLTAGPLWIKQKLHMEKQIRDELGYDGEFLYAEYHESHAASVARHSPEASWHHSLEVRKPLRSKGSLGRAHATMMITSGRM